METPNLEYIKEISGGDKEFENEMISILKIEFPEEYMLLKKNFENKNFEEVALNIHKIKHKIGMLGMQKSFELATKLEQNIKNAITLQFDDLLLILDRITVYLSHK